ncbi:ABC transporter permease [Nocardia stercoris]|uniref:Transport permease protein n=1 Tax=Nocardia stercoris TaxID=2483361 RepID=A0A3M2L5V2_9NOCA|nr:ABC transporter permease [Nocardia stercoris]RMI31923.1 peptide ABC transporter permease [Nocardia stercoris]
MTVIEPATGSAVAQLDREALLLPEVSGYPENSVRAWFSQSLIQCKRLMSVWVTDFTISVYMLVFPTLALIMFNTVLGDSVKLATGVPAIYGQMPMSAVIAAMNGSMVGALTLRQEKETGLLGRFHTMPINRWAGLTSRLLAEVVRVLLTTMLMLAVGLILGFRFWNGPWAALGMILVPVLFALGFGTLVTAMATVTDGLALVNLIFVFNTLAMFFNTGFVPAAAYPKWLQGVVEHQPMSTTINTMKGLSWDGPIQRPLLETCAWMVGMVVIFAYPAIRGYERAARTSI